MKNLIITLVTSLTLGAAYADPFAETDNLAGGKITILTDQCDGKPQQSRAYYFTKEGMTEDGCWRYDGDTVVVEWDKLGRRRYPINYFKLLNQYSKFKAW